MTSRSMELFRRGRLLAVSGALAVGSLAAAAAPAHATGTLQLSIAPANSATCPLLTFSGQGFTNNGAVQIHVYRNGSYVTSFNTTATGSGSLPPLVTYHNNFSGAGSFSAYADDYGSHRLVWSNRTAACSK